MYKLTDVQSGFSSGGNCYSITGVNDAKEFRIVMVHYLCSLKMIGLHRLLNDFLLLLDWTN